MSLTAFRHRDYRRPGRTEAPPVSRRAPGPLHPSGWSRAGQTVAVAGLVAGLALASVWTGRVAWADYSFQKLTLPGTERALALTPGQAPYWTRLALLLADADPARSEQAFERVVALNPLDANAWVELGLRAEARGDLAYAEQCLLRAADVDKGYLPRWSLANYYFRRQDPGNFWLWVHQAVTMAYGDPAPLFRLCWNFTDQGNRIAELLAIDRPSLQASYLIYLLDQNRVEYVLSAARRLKAWQRAEDQPLLMRACDRMIEENRPEDAVEIWNALAEARHETENLLAPAGGASLVNGRFAASPSSHGFDWRLPEVDGVNAVRQNLPAGLRFSLSGRQPENCQLLEQYVPVVEKRRYELAFRYRTGGVPPGSGLHWRVLDSTGSVVLAQTESLSSEQEVQDQLRFTTGASGQLLRLVLEYDRPSGSVRVEGSVTIQNVALTLTLR